MNSADTGVPIEYDPLLVEQAVFLRISGDPLETAFHAARERLYLLQDPAQKEAAFQRFHVSWFARLALGRLVSEALAELPALPARAQRLCLFPALHPSQEGADFHPWRAPQPNQLEPAGAVVIRLTAARLLPHPEALYWLRHELMHVADMLDPAFAYSPVWPASPADPLTANLQRERYRVLWDAWIDGRLHRRGTLPQAIRRRRLADFTRAFGSPPDAAARFDAVFGADALTHAGLVEMALLPATNIAGETSRPPAALPCPICRFPTFELTPPGAEIDQNVLNLIQADFPSWRLEHGLCRQCADLYRSREISAAEAALLPGIR
ncbi:MAG: hypothetical protein FJW20_01705 [Acidimicrobiia bacterium]|nr:hypothetical protein [Acidimicrobiia bacterium]